MISNVKEARNILEQKKGKRMQLKNRLHTLRAEIAENKTAMEQHEQAREIIKQIGQETQHKVKYHISNITSMALETVFDNAYELVIDFIERRNNTEADIYFARDGYVVNPMEESGGGAINITAFALRIASWSMQMPKSRNLVILDEPFKHLKGLNENRQVLEMIQEISQKLGIQIITVSDERIDRAEIEQRADKVIKSRIETGVTVHETSGKF
jgi:DNA repair exonuclease SbcCD ATPase subunit